MIRFRGPEPPLDDSDDADAEEWRRRKREDAEWFADDQVLDVNDLEW